FYNLADKPSQFSGNLRERAYLLLRVFFYEFSRIQDVFSRFIKELMRLGMINRDTVKFLREQFNEIFKDGIKLRNKIVHERMSWPGKENLDLIIVSTINQLGEIAVEKETLKERTINQVLIKFYNKWAPQFLVEGMHMANMLQHLVNKFSQIVQEKETQELKHSQGQEDLI
ncbi:MAG: hypothetical protein Q8M71_03695, partial [Thermodesulfovibrionales bacterium]|nr:hypothetical protein [Thermodesulfovibrionales bacterium]